MIEMPQQKPVHERLRILVVEDSDMLREMFLKAFPSAHTVHAASSVKEGWKLYLDTTPHIVFMDIGLPDGNGHDLAQKIKDYNPAAYVVMATANRDRENKEEALLNRVDGFIVKPFSKEEINGYVDRFLTIHRQNLHKK